LPDPTPPRNLLLPGIAVLVLGLMALVFPPLALVAGILSPVPLIFVYLQVGKGAGLAVVAVIFGVLLAVMGPMQAILFLAEYAVLAVIMAETLRLGFSFDRCVGFSASGSTLLSIFLLLVSFSGSEEPLSVFFKKHFEANIQQSLDSLKTMGESAADLAEMKRFADKASETFAVSFPAIIAIGSLITAAINFFLVRFLMVRFHGPSISPPEKFSEWILPEQMVWPLLLSGAAVVLTEGMLDVLGLNVLLVLLVIYFFQGWAIIARFFEIKNVPGILWALALLLILVQPILIGLVIGLGVFDIWIDFRKLKPRPSTGPDDEDQI